MEMLGALPCLTALDLQCEWLSSGLACGTLLLPAMLAARARCRQPCRCLPSAPADAQIESFPGGRLTRLRKLSLASALPEPLPPGVAECTQLRALAGQVEAESVDRLLGLWPAMEAALRPLRSLKVSACVHGMWACGRGQVAALHKTWVLVFLSCKEPSRAAVQVARLDVMLGQDRDLRYFNRQQEESKGRALLGSLWDSSGLTARLELTSYDSVEHWPDE